MVRSEDVANAIHNLDFGSDGCFPGGVCEIRKSLIRIREVKMGREIKNGKQETFTKWGF